MFKNNWKLLQCIIPWFLYINRKCYLRKRLNYSIFFFLNNIIFLNKEKLLKKDGRRKQKSSVNKGI